MDEAGVYVGIAAILASVISLFIPDTALPNAARSANAARVPPVFPETPAK